MRAKYWDALTVNTLGVHGSDGLPVQMIAEIMGADIESVGDQEHVETVDVLLSLGRLNDRHLIHIKDVPLVAAAPDQLQPEFQRLFSLEELMSLQDFVPYVRDRDTYLSRKPGTLPDDRLFTVPLLPDMPQIDYFPEGGPA